MPASGVDQSQPRRGTVAGAEFAWIDEASRQPESGEPPFVFVHGFTGHRDDFIGVAGPLAERRRVIAPDLRGHGDSVSKPGVYGWTFEQLVKDLLDLLEHLAIDRCDLLGHSMGGMVSLRFALAHPERIRSLVFMCSAPARPQTLDRAGFETGAQIAEARGVDGLQALMEKAGRLDASDSIRSWGERYWTHHRRRLCAMTPESFRGIGTAFFDSDSLVDRLPEVAARTLVLVGEHDADFLPGADLFEQHLPRVDRRTIAAAEHHPHQENEGAWRAALEAHLDAARRDTTHPAIDANERIPT